MWGTFSRTSLCLMGIGTLLGLVLAGCATSPPPVLAWQMPTVETVSVLSKEDVSVTPHVDNLSILFDKAVVDLQTADDPLHKTWVGVIDAPMTLAEGEKARLSHVLMGHIGKSEGVSAQLVIRVNGKTRICDFPRGKTMEEPINVAFPEEVIGAGKRNYPILLVLTAERRCNGDFILFGVDSLDIAPPFKTEKEP